MTRKQRWEIGAAAALVVTLLTGAVGGGVSWYRQYHKVQLHREMLAALGAGDGTRVSRLIAQGANPAVIGPNGTTALMAAARTGDLSLARRVLSAGVDVDAGTVSGRQTALMGAASRGNAPMVAFLIAGGANVNVRDHAGVTPLMFAAARGELKTIKHLLRAGADVDAKDRLGQTALSRARRRPWAAEATRLLRKSGAKQ